MTTNILDNLINEGDELRMSIEIVPLKYGERRTYIKYRTTSPNYKEWMAAVRRFINSYYPSDISVVRSASISGISLNTHDVILGMLKAIRLMPEEPMKTKDNTKGDKQGITIHNNHNINQSSHQTNSQNVTQQLFLDAIKDELTGKQVKEVADILHEYEDDPEPTRIKLLEKIKSFGGDVLTNIVANILTNPTVYQGLM